MLDQIIPPSFTRKLKQTEGVKGSFAHLELPPKFTQIPARVSVVCPGQSKVKVCGTPELIPKWFKDGAELASGRKYKISFSRMISSLNVLSAEKVDSGEYTFEIMNEVGKDLSKINLTVLGSVFTHYPTDMWEEDSLKALLP
uniref:Ig-like domain-containing protein n=1 Tax=Oreochromis aureus TaxID=47969 RepID=A0A668VHV6_OREAU